MVWKVKDLTGEEFGRLTVLGRSDNIGIRVMWDCRCHCGEDVCVSGGNLRSGNSQSCGCLRNERIRDSAKKKKLRKKTGKKVIDLTGKVFGKLTVVKQTRKNNRVHWLCNCECGKSAIVATSNLNNSRSTSCGCTRKGEKMGCNKTHGLSDTPDYRAHRGMMSSVYYEYSNMYDLNKAKGIVVEERLHTLEGYIEAFGIRRSGYRLLRKDTNKSYTVDNMHWVEIKSTRKVR